MRSNNFGRLLVLALLAQPVTSTHAATPGVDDKLEETMHKCVTAYARIHGDPLGRPDTWGSILGEFAKGTYSALRFEGIGGHPSLEAAMTHHLVSDTYHALNVTGRPASKDEVQAVVDACMPETLRAAAAEAERLANSPCPDDSQYLKSVKLLKMSEVELHREFGSGYFSDIKTVAFMIRGELDGLYPHIFYFGRSTYPEFVGQDAAGLNRSLHAIDKDKMSEALQPVSDALDVFMNYSGEKTEHIKSYIDTLTCLKETLKTYPSEEIGKFLGK